MSERTSVLMLLCMVVALTAGSLATWLVKRDHLWHGYSHDPAQVFGVSFHSYGVSYWVGPYQHPFNWHLTLSCRPDHLSSVWVLKLDGMDTRFVGQRSYLEHFTGYLNSYSSAIGWRISVAKVSTRDVATYVAGQKLGVIVDATGYMPADLDLSALKAWLESGGVLVWFGDRLGYWTWGTQGRTRARQALDIVLWGRTIYEAAPQTIEARPLPDGKNVGLAFRWHTWGPSPRLVQSLGGKVLGWTTPDGGRVSTAILPVGRGAVVIFGDRLARERSYALEGATDVVNLLYRGLVYPAFEVVAGSYRQGVDFGLLSTRLQCSDEWAVLGSTDRWMYSFAVSGPKEGP